jgi:acyl-CoA dehydrogenase
MTETVTDGAGSDPSLLNTEARQDGDEFVINGRKWMITGAPGATLNIVMARTFDAKNQDISALRCSFSTSIRRGFKLTRVLDTIERTPRAATRKSSSATLRVPRDAVLGQLGKGFRNAQVRLGPARLTHCMRWLGQARRCHSIAVDYARKRHSFGRTLGEHQGVGFMLADNDAWPFGTRPGSWTSTTRHATRPR